MQDEVQPGTEPFLGGWFDIRWVRRSCGLRLDVDSVPVLTSFYVVESASKSASNFASKGASILLLESENASKKC
jgi:hypothetical protein